MNTMKYPNTHRASTRRPVSARSFAGLAITAGLLLSGSLALCEPVNLLKVPFTNAPSGNLMPSDTSLGGSNVNLTMYSAAGVASPYQGAVGSGVNGVVSGARALCLTNGAFATQPGQPFEPANATSGGSGANAAAYALDSSDAALGFGNITNFIVTMWVNQYGKMGTVNPVGPRLFILNAGAPASDTGAANSIGVKYQANNQLQFGINAANTLGAALASDLVASKWQFLAWVYDGTNLYQYYGSDSAPAQLVSTAASASQTVALGSSASLIIGNRTGSPAHTRGLNGWIEDFRFYNGVSTNNLSFVESIRKEISPKVPTITGIYPDGTALLQATNRLVFNASSSSGLNLTSIGLAVNGVNVSSSCTYVTNGTAGTSTNVDVSYTGLPQQRTDTAVMTATDSLGLTATATVTFDTFNPTNFIVKADEFDFNSGQFIDNPVYTNVVDDPGVTTTYFGLDSVDGIDTRKGAAAGAVNDVNCYRATDGAGTRTQTPLAAGELPSPTRFGGSDVPSHMVGNWSSAEWQNYTKTFPAGVYNVYARVSSSSSSTITFDQVTAGQGTDSQTLYNLGSFIFSGASLTAFQWVPLMRFGQLATVDLTGVKTVRATTGGGAAADFYMLVAANTNVPTISGVYPNGQVLFQPTNKLVFTVSSAAANISTANIHLTLNGTNVDASLVFAGGPSTWNCSYTGLQLKQTYAVVIQVTDNSANSSSATFNIDTWNPVFQFEAEDFDFDGGHYIDNPVPTTSQAANSYFWRVGVMNVDESNNNAAAPYAGANPANYRANPGNPDPIACTPVTDTKRQQFSDASAPDYNVGFMGPFYWQNYTKTWPTGTFNIYMRVAAGATSPTIQHEGFDQITAGWGTTAQGIKHIGGFNIPRTGGWSVYQYVPLLDQFGNYANVILGGTNTFRATFARSLGTDYATDANNGAVNINFYMLLPARTDVARLDNVYPDGLAHFQATNRLSFTASSSYGITTNNIVVTLNGVNISTDLVFSGSATSWIVSYPGLAPNSTYTAVLQVTDNNGSVATTTVTFDTFSPANFTWQAEDYDFGGGQYIDNPAPNSYFGQVGISYIDQDYAQTVAGETFVYRGGVMTSDAIGTQVSADTLLPSYVAAQQTDGTVRNYNVAWWYTNAWMNYTRTFPTGNYVVYGRLAGGATAGLPYTNALYQVTSGWGTDTQTTSLLGTFEGVGAGGQAWQWVRLSANGRPVIVSLSGTNTLRVATLSGNANADFFMLAPVPPSVSLRASLDASNIILSFPTAAGFGYTVEYKDDLTAGTWMPLPQGSNIWGDGSVKSVSVGPSGDKRFYRLAIPIP
jgi:hypothetical protein